MTECPYGVCKEMQELEREVSKLDGRIEIMNSTMDRIIKKMDWMLMIMAALFGQGIINMII